MHNSSSWSTNDDRWEEIQAQGSAVLGIKHLLTLPGGMGFIKSVVAYTDFYDTYSEGFVDSSFNRINSYHHNFRYPALRFSFLLNNKLSSKRNHTNRYEYTIIRCQDGRSSPEFVRTL